MSDRILHQTAWIDLYDRAGYIFAHTHNSIVYLLPFMATAAGHRVFLARIERCPAHGPQHEMTSISGQCRPGQNPDAVAIQELREEGGYRGEPQQLIRLKSVHLVKFADTLAHLYAIDVTGMPQEQPRGDGTPFEADAWVRWVKHPEETQDVNCPVFFAMIALLTQDA